MCKSYCTSGRGVKANVQDILHMVLGRARRPVR
jgi:hypothetical protein